MKEQFNRKIDAEEKDENVWTSNSDLFMVLAIVFLFLFVFTLLKSSVMTLQNQSKIRDIVEYQKGKVPSEKKEQIVSLQATLNKGVEKLVAQEQAVLKKMEELKDFKNQVKSYQTQIDEVLQEFSTQQGMMAKANETISNHEKDIQTKADKIEYLFKRQDQLTEQLNVVNKEKQKLAEELKFKESEWERDVLSQRKAMEKEMALQKNTFTKELNEQKQLFEKQLTNEQTSFDNQLKEYEKVYNTQSAQVKKESQRKVEEAQKDFNQKIVAEQQSFATQLKQVEDSFNKQMDQQQKQFDKNLKSAQSSYQSRLNQRLSQIAGYQKEVTELQKSLGESQKKLAKLQGNYSDLLSKYNKSQGDLGKANKLNRGLSNELESKKGQISKLRGEVGNLGDQIKSLKSEHGAKVGQLGDRIAGLSRQVDSQKNNIGILNKQLRKKKNELSRVEKELKKLAKVKEIIGKRVADRLEKAGIDVQIDPATGTVTLSMDDTFKFRNNSFELSKKAKEKLQMLIPTYVEALLGQKDIANLVEQIQIAGHASPRYKYKHFEPLEGSEDAYQYNLNLSFNRARQVTSYVFSKEMGEFAFRPELKNMIVVTGFSFMQPVGLQENNILEACGTYDCGKSRRVEISFKLKESMVLQQVIDKIKNL